MGNVLLKILLAGLGQRVAVAILIAVLERAQAAALETSTPLDDVLIAGVLDGLRKVEKTEAE